MKVIQSISNEQCQEITLEKKMLFGLYTKVTKYRRFRNTNRIFEFTDDEQYKLVSYLHDHNIKPYFHIFITNL